MSEKKKSNFNQKNFEVQLELELKLKIGIHGHTCRKSLIVFFSVEPPQR